MPISFNSLGNYGRLGNQMFQYAALKGIANKINTNYIIPESNNEMSSQQLTDIFLLNNNVGYGITNYKQVQELDFKYDNLFIQTITDNTDIKGYFQSEKYFKHIEQDIKNDFTFKQTYSIPDKKYVSIHVRRGDYLLLQNYHPTCSIDYYKNAMTLFPNHNFLVISDDINWCKNQEIFANCEFWEGKNIAHDLYVMTKAEHNIIANSSFSWWGAWLNQNADRIVVAPKQWFGNAIQNDTKDLYCFGWIIL